MRRGERRDPDSAENVAESPTSVAPVTGEQSDQLIGFVTALLGVADPNDTAKAFEPAPDQQVVKQCVEAAGFEYYIYVPLANDPSTTMTADDYAATWGLGITAQILGTYPQPSTDDIDYVTSLSESERAAYGAVVADCLSPGFTASPYASDNVSSFKAC